MAKALPNDDFVPTCLEIHQALLTMGPFKAPGPDGIHAAFYQKHWDIVGRKLCLEIQHIFLSSSMNPQWNDCVVTLIPKIDGPKMIKHYDPIGLCNVTYKIVTKIIVRELTKIMGDIISPNQTGFVSGRQGIDNVLILQEMVYHFRKTKSSKGGMTIKLDLDKAYDLLEWSFIRETLIFYKIMSCVSTSAILTAVNGEKTNAFNPSRGLGKETRCLPISSLCVLNISRER